MAALSEVERAKVLRYLGYPSWRDVALVWGIPFPTHIEPQYYINDALDRITDVALEFVRRDLVELDDIENQMSEARCRLRASKIGDITLNPNEIEDLRAEKRKWTIQLANEFEASPNPFALDPGSSRNGTVVG